MASSCLESVESTMEARSWAVLLDVTLWIMESDKTAFLEDWAKTDEEESWGVISQLGECFPLSFTTWKRKKNNNKIAY